jgi:DNA-binding PadR family transcriptional regulator
MSLGGMVLGLLEQASGHGYDLKTRHDQHFGTRRLALPQVYATLSRLERDGAVAVAGVERSGGPDRTVYSVTPSGVRKLESWLVEPESSAAYLQSTVFTKVVLALLSGRDPRAVVDVQRTAQREQMRQLTADKNGASLERTLALDLALFHLEADLRWLDHTEARLDALTEEIR